ncbi:MAG: MMPL family transporter [Actinobacteria bacterium]|nr:MMPL family transporter [Actinomycetota bacterium]
MLGRLGRFTVARRRWILLSTLVGLVVAGAYGGGVANLLSGGGFSDPNAESVRAAEVLEEKFDAGNPNLILLVDARAGTVDDPAVARAGAALTQELAGERDIVQAFSYWTLGNAPPLASRDKSQALLMARIHGSEEHLMERAEELSDRFAGSAGPIDVRIGGQAEIFRQVNEQIEKDLARAEMLTFPIILIVLVLVFGSVVAAGLPLFVGIVSVIGTFLVLRVLVSFTDVSIYALNLTTMMGLGLGIDYSLFMVSRYREELRAGMEPHAAVVRTVETAGRTVLFSALTVAISLAALMVFPLFFLRSFAYAGIAVVAMAALGTLVALPALLAALGHRVNKWVLWKHKPVELGTGFWHRLAMFVMKRPIPISLAIVAILLVLGAPFLNVKFGTPDDRVLPKDAPARRVHDDIRANFTSEEAGALQAVATDVDPRADQDEIATFASDLSGLEDVARVDALTGSYVDGRMISPPNRASQRFAAADATWFSIVPSVEPISPEGEELVDEVRTTDGPFAVRVTGPSADLVDGKASIFGRAPVAGLIIAVVTFVVLFLMTGSVLVPIKALILNLLSLTAAFGAMVWVFQEGHFSSFLDFTATGTIDSTNPILMFCVAFGLSMDYEVFLLSRIKEEHDRTGDNIASVAIGLEKTGRIVTAAAATIAVVFLAFSTSGITFIKLIGIGLALAVLMDATLIRGTLVPAFMRLAGELNWWAPRPLKRIYERWGFREAPSEPGEAREPVPAPTVAGG